MPRTKKAPYVPNGNNKMSVDQMSRVVCTELNNWRKEHNEDAYFAIYKCPCCGRYYSTQEVNFYKSPSPLYTKNNGYAIICRTCSQINFDQIYRENGDVYMTMKIICHELDWPYDEDLFKTVNDKNRLKGHILDVYASAISASKYSIGLSFSDSIVKHYKTLADEEQAREEAEAARLQAVNEQDQITVLEDTANVIDDTHPEEEQIDEQPQELSEEMIAYYDKARRFFGKSYNEEQLDYLQKEYDDWITRNECKTKAQEELFKNICIIQLRDYEGRATKDDIKNLQDLMDSGNLKPRQQAENDLGSTDTLGTLIRKLEETQPIPEPQDDWKDVDGIGHLIRTYFMGHLSKMFGFDNKYSQEYDEEMAKYTVEPPTYTDEDLGTSISSVIFKSDVDDN